MKTAVDKVKRGKQRNINIRFSAMASHYLFHPEFCNPAAGWEKGQIEKNVQDARHRIWNQLPEFTTLAALNDWLHQRCLALWHEIPHPEHNHCSIGDVYSDEQAYLMALPPPLMVLSSTPNAYHQPVSSRLNVTAIACLRPMQAIRLAYVFMQIDWYLSAEHR